MAKVSEELGNVDYQARYDELKNKSDKTKKEIEAQVAYEFKLREAAGETEKQRKRREAEEDHQARLEYYEKEGKVVKSAIGKAFGSTQATLETLGNLTNNLTKRIDTVIENYVKTQQRLTAGLIGTDTTLSSMTRSLTEALSNTNLVKQEAVYNKLGELISSGIVYNVSQRAFLETLSDDIGLSLANTSDALNRLINIQQTDLYSNRLAIQYSLKEFLNQNYDTSTYIQKAFTSVSESLLEAQALTTAANAVDIETAIQTWLGSYYSAGVNDSTVTGLAQALNALGSGDVSSIGSGISNLVLMGVARAGLNYGDLLNNGFDSSQVNQIMTGITNYLVEMGASSSNVVRSQLSQLYGINVADLIAASNVSGASGMVTSDISNMLGAYSNLVPWAVQTQNSLDNFFYNWGTNIASNQGSLMSYKIEEFISNSVGNILGGTNKADARNAGTALKLAPLLTLASSLFGNGNSSIRSLLTIGDTLFMGGNSSSGLLQAFQLLSSANGVAGSTMKVSGEGVSGSGYISNGDSSSLLDNSINSLNDFENTVKTGDEKTIDENVNTITSTVDSILSVLKQYFTTIDYNVGMIYSAVQNQR